MDDETIWYKDVTGFLSTKEQLYSFIPIPDTSLASQLNAIVRFSIYYGVIVFIFQLSAKALLIPLLVGGVTFLVYEHEINVELKDRESMQSMGVERDIQTKRVCSSPTLNNPFMNVLPSEYGLRPNRSPACDLSRPSVKKKVEELYEEKFPNAKYSRDIYGRNTGLRQFYSNPSTTIPNDQATYAAWLYSDRSIRKTRREV
jgi:hypothetical protein